MKQIYLYAAIFLFTLTVALFSVAVAAQAKPSETFDEWLVAMKQKARDSGISESTINNAFGSDLTPNSRIIELDGKQPESTMTFEKYRRLIVNQTRIDKGRRLFHQHADALETASQRFGVPPQYIVALWGIETNFGTNTGGFDVIEALATLAWDGRRRDFFTAELLHALEIIDQGHITHEAMTGSWAGAMGQNQFMPSSFKSYAVDGNGDGRKDIWQSLPDVFASTANYLSRQGWKEDERWGREVRVSQSIQEQYGGLDKRYDLSRWRALGVTLPNGNPIPVVAGMKASLVLPDGVGGAVFLVYNNYRAIMKWNRSTYFATSVGLLADSIATGH